MENSTNIMENAVMLTLKLSSLSNHKKISNTYVDTQADKSLVRASKTLMAADELSIIFRTDGRIRRHLMDVGLQSYFKTGIYLIPIQQVIDRVFDNPD